MNAFAGWTLSVEVSRAAAEIFAQALEPLAVATSLFETADRSTWRVEAIATERPDTVALVGAIALAARLAGVEEPEIRCVPLTGIDWVRENQKSFQPIPAGRFFVHPTHFDGVVPAGATALAIDAGPAFGTGAHGSTLGCLRALDWMARRGYRPGRILDLGCGSGILAIGAARRWHCRVGAADIDTAAVATTRDNARLNDVASLVRPIHSTGLRNREIVRRGPYNLILANILAGPLVDMARDITRLMAPGGTLILAGFLVDQERTVRAAYPRQDYHRVRKEVSNGWTTVVLTRFGGRR